jgi:DNA-binding response OmpR family regulator
MHVLTQEVGLGERAGDNKQEVLPEDSDFRAEAPSGDGDSAVSVLVAVSDESVREPVVALLKSQGYRTVVCGDADDAISAVEAREFNLVLAEAGPAQIDGFELLSAMKAKAAEVPVILLTSQGSHEEQEEEGLRLGATDCVRKPVHREILALRVRNALDARNRIEEASPAK